MSAFRPSERKGGRRGPTSVCFFAPVDDKAKLEHVGFYAQDLEALKELGYKVEIATRWREVPWGADLYFVWWWTWAFKPIIKAKFSRSPVVITGTFNLRWGKGDYFHRPWWQRWLIRTSTRLATQNVLVSQHELEPMKKLGWTPNLEYSPHCVDTSLYVPDGVRDANTLLTIGWMRESNAVRKGMPQIIRAMPAILEVRPDTKLIVAGDHDDGQAALNRLAVSLGVEHAISWPGRISDEAKLLLLQSCSAYLQPSVYEGFGLAIVEAMSCGAPVVTRPVGAVPEVVGDAAILVDDNPSTLARAVVKLLEDREFASELGIRARDRATEHFDLARRREDLRKVIGEALSHS